MGSNAVLSDRVENLQNSQKLGGIFLNVSLEMLRKFKKNLSKNFIKKSISTWRMPSFSIGVFRKKNYLKDGAKSATKKA